MPGPIDPSAVESLFLQITIEEVWEALAKECSRCEDEEAEAWMREHFTRFARIVPLEAFPVFELSETAVASGIGVLGILLTFPVVARRRPA